MPPTTTRPETEALSRPDLPVKAARAARRAAVPLLLVSLTFAAFAPAFRNGFTNWDDPAYITEYRLVRGLSAERISAAFRGFHVENYNPLHIVSYMVDHELWGLHASGFLATNLVLHIAAGLLLLRALVRLGVDRWAAAFAAGVFLLHPTRAESVVWLSERKDVLAGFFSMAALLLHVEGTRRESAETSPPARRAWCAGTLVCFLLALLSKSQVVTLPLALLGVDVYRRRALRPALIEKLPLLALSAVFAAVTFAARASGEGVLPAGGPALGSIQRPLAALPCYALHLVFPLGLSPLYGTGPSWSMALGAGLPVLVLLLAVMAWSWRRDRVVLAGSIWFLALLFPVSGVVTNQVFIADRYLYLAAIGPAWIAGDLLARHLSATSVRSIALAAGITLAFLTASYSTVWRSSETLWTRVLEHAPGTPVALANLGMHHLENGRTSEARRLFEEDLRELPSMEESYFGLAEVRAREGDTEGAIALLREALERRPRSSKAAVRLAAFLEKIGRPGDALRVIERRDPPVSFALHQTLVRIHLALGNARAARSEAVRSVEIDPFHEEGWYHLALVEERLGNEAAAVRGYRTATEREPSFQPAWEALASLLVRMGDPEEALLALENAPHRTAVWWNLRSLGLAATGAADRALAAIREATEIEPERATYWANRARLALRLGERKEAEDSVARALEADPAIAGSLDPELAKLRETETTKSRP